MHPLDIRNISLIITLDNSFTYDLSLGYDYYYYLFTFGIFSKITCHPYQNSKIAVLLVLSSINHS